MFDGIVELRAGAERLCLVLVSLTIEQGQHSTPGMQTAQLQSWRPAETVTVNTIAVCTGIIARVLRVFSTSHCHRIAQMNWTCTPRDTTNSQSARACTDTSSTADAHACCYREGLVYVSLLDQCCDVRHLEMYTHGTFIIHPPYVSCTLAGQSILTYIRTYTFVCIATYSTTLFLIARQREYWRYWRRCTHANKCICKGSSTQTHCAMKTSCCMYNGMYRQLIVVAHHLYRQRLDGH
jgi:hypothetical protein